MEAVFRQTYPLKDIVVIDDASYDKTIDVVSKHNNVKVIRHKKNKGLAAVRNTAIKNIKSEFIASIDSDCLPRPDWLEQLMKKFNSTRVVGAGGRLSEAYTNTICDSWRAVHMKQHWGKKQTKPDFLFGSNTVFRRARLLEVGVYNEKLRNNYEDVDISLRLKKRGGVLIYEPKAVAYHQKRDEIYTLLNTYWQWNLRYYQKRKFYSTLGRFVFKIKDNIGLANRYIEEDIKSKRYNLLYLDFLLALHHSLKDFEYFILHDKQSYFKNSLLPFWISLIDLTFFYHLGISRRNMPTLAPKGDSLLQNYFALNLVIGKVIQDNFKDDTFKKILYKQLFWSFYKVEDSFLLNKLLILIELHNDWDGLLKKQQRNLNSKFLNKLSISFQKWTEDLIYRFPNIIHKIESSAKKAEMELSLSKEGGSV